MSDIVIVLKEGNPITPSNPKSWRISLPADVAVKHLLDALIPKLGLPTQQHGHKIIYRLFHEQSGRTLSDEKTLFSAGVASNDTCLLLREQYSRNTSTATPVSSRTEKVKPKKPQKPEKLEKPQKNYVEVEERRRDFPTVEIRPELLYTDQHVWIDVIDGMGRVGVTDFMAQVMFLIFDLELPEEGQWVTAGGVVCTLWFLTESMEEEFDSPVFSPVSGVISQVNEKLKDRFLHGAELELLQDDPYGDGWLFTIQLSESAGAELERLWDARTYQQFIYDLLKSS